MNMNINNSDIFIQIALNAITFNQKEILTWVYPNISDYHDELIFNAVQKAVPIKL